MQQYIPASDSQFKAGLFQLFEFATTVVYKLEPKYGQNSGEKKHEPPPHSSGNLKYQFTILYDDFLDHVFDTESTLPREEWEEKTVETSSYIFFPEMIREKVDSMQTQMTSVQTDTEG